MIRAATLFIVGFHGTAPPPPLLQRIREGRAGGVILFGRNFGSPLAEHLLAAADLCEQLQAAAPPGPPLIVSADQEGGRVQRLRAPFTVWPPMGRLGGPQAAEAAGRALGAELALVGINLDYAPVLDIHTNPDNPVIGDRAFATTPEEVAARALAFWRGLESAGVRGCGKHFPGHGDTELDSHLCLPRVDHGAERLRAVELLPFAAAARAGVGMIMTAHVVYPALDPRPATLSPVWLTQVLRRELAFSGVVVSDDMDMRAVAGDDVGEVVTASLLAGCDAFLLCKDEARQLAAEEALERAAERDSRVRTRIAEAAARLLEFRATLSRHLPDRARLLRLPDAENAALAAEVRT
jgi:beta-N-acetylhexosaminidase